MQDATTRLFRRPSRPSTARRLRVTAAALFVASFAALNASAAGVILAESTFDPGSPNFDTWTAVQCNNPGVCPLFGGEAALVAGGAKFFHNAAGGSPFGPFPGAGNLETIDPDDDTAALFNAPGKFTSVIAAGQTLSFDYKINGTEFDNDDPGNPFPDLVPLLYLQNGGAVMVYAVPELLATLTLGLWFEWDIPLVPNGPMHTGPGAWFTALGPDDGTTFAAVFGGGEPVLRIWGELTKDVLEADGVQLDNVQLTVIPVPAALPMMLAGLVAVGAAARRRG